MTYDLSGFGAANNPLSMFVAANSAVDGLFGGLALLSLFIVVLSASLLRQNPPPESFFFASLLSGVVSLLFLYIGLGSVIYVVGFSIIAAASAIALYRSRTS